MIYVSLLFLRTANIHKKNSVLPTDLLDAPFIRGIFFTWNKVVMNLIEQLKRHEGCRGNFYYCTMGKKTIGIGRNVDDKPFTKGELEFLGRCEFDLKPMTESEAEHLLVNDLNEIKAQLKSILTLADLCRPRQAVIINMAYNLGISGFKRFKKTIRYVIAGEYELAAQEMLDSRWADQVGRRSDELAHQMFYGEWV